MKPLDRFLSIHEKQYQIALQEIKSGKKTSHWIKSQLFIAFVQVTSENLLDKGILLIYQYKQYWNEIRGEIKKIEYMTLEHYKKSLIGTPKPTIKQTENFINAVANDHSWYKHLPDQRLEPFIFYLTPNDNLTVKNVTDNEKNTDFKSKENTRNIDNSPFGNWQYIRIVNDYHSNFTQNSNESLIKVEIIDNEGKWHKMPEAIIIQGKFMMSKFLHKRAFENAFEYIDNDGISFADKHKALINELRLHLNSFVAFVYVEM